MQGPERPSEPIARANTNYHHPKLAALPFETRCSAEPALRHEVVVIPTLLVLGSSPRGGIPAFFFFLFRSRTTALQIMLSRVLQQDDASLA